MTEIELAGSNYLTSLLPLLPEGYPPDRIVIGGISTSGIAWFIAAAPLPGLNGYVRLPDGHPWLKYPEITWEGPEYYPHGGFTYTQGPWVGFDTLHAGDIWPQSELVEIARMWPERLWKIHYEMFPRIRTDWDKEWSMEAVLAEVQSLIKMVEIATILEEANTKEIGSCDSPGSSE